MKTTIVSAHIPAIGYNVGTKTENDYLAHATKLLSLPHHKIIFVIDEMVERVSALSDIDTTIIIPFKKEDLMLFDMLSNPDIRLPFNRNRNKDVREYFILINSKVKFLKIASELNPFDTGQFVWVDFGISHVFDEAHQLCDYIKDDYEFGDKMRVAGIWTPPVEIDLSNNVSWVFAGGVAGGSIDAINYFYGDCMSQLLRNAKEGYLTWEVNVWNQIIKEKPGMIDWYRSSHDYTILKNL